MKNQKFVAIAYGSFCHLSFGVAIFLMFISILNGLSINNLKCDNLIAYLINLVLIFQFPVLHSFLLSERGSKGLDYFSPKEIAKKMRTTVFASIAAWQLILLFVCWRNSQVVIYKSTGSFWYFHFFAYLLAWVYLGLSIKEAGSGLQTGFIGWYSVYKDQPTKFPKLPTKGLHAQCRHPIYLAFALILLTTPCLSLDLLILNCIWIPYCLFAPKLKEQRLGKYNPELYPRYKNEVPYMLPKVISKMLCSSTHFLKKIYEK